MPGIPTRALALPCLLLSCLTLFGWGCTPAETDEDPPAADQGPAPDPCAETDCGARICALIDGAATCICPAGTVEGGDGACATPGDPCADVDCGARLCAVFGGAAACVCPEGELPDGDGCAPPSPSPCTALDCGERACAVVDGAAVCVCPPGLFDDGEGGCTDGPPAGPCAAIECPDDRLCAADGDEARCVCPPGTVDDGDACAAPADDPCLQADCGPRLCAVVDGAAACVCPLGQLPEGDGCAPMAPPACAAVDCGDRLCALAGGEPVCVCPPDRFDDGAGGCADAAPAGPCAAAPCPADQLCAAVDGEAVCVCPPGTLDDGAGGCAPPAPRPCADDPCPDGRLCAIGADDQPVCACEPGLLPAADGDGCVPPDGGPADPCTPNPCEAVGRSVCRAVAGVAICTCGPGFVDDGAACVPAPGGPCDPNPCVDENRTACQPAGDVAICACDPGYADAGGACVLADPCAQAVCPEPGRGQCVAVDGLPVCACDPGLVEDAETGACVVDDPCDPNPCELPGRTVCRPVDDVVICECDAGTLPLADGSCRAPAPCEPNPCVAPGRAVCEVSPEGPVCRCDPGLIEDPETGACVLEPFGDCEDSHAEGDVFEPDECPPEATPIAAGDVQAHSIMPAGDNDWYVLDAMPGHIYRFAVTRDGLRDAYVYLYDSDGMTSLRAHDSPEAIKYEMPDAGPYYYRVRAYSNVQTGDYSVTVTDEGLDDHGDGPEDATPIAADGVAVPGEIQVRGDNDWFAFEAEADRIYRFAVTRETMTDAYVYLYRPDGSTIAQGHDSPESITYEVDEGGTWYIRVRHYSNVVSSGTYTVTLTDEGLDDHADTPDGASPIGVDGQAVGGRIETRSDRDNFVFQAQANHVYRIALSRGSLSDGYLNLYDPAGDSRVSSDTETVYYEPDVDGPWTVRVRHYNNVGTGDYTLTVDDRGPDDHGDIAEDATPLAVGDEAVGDIETGGDRDWFAVELDAGRIYRMSMARDGLSDGVITLYAPDGQTVLVNADSETILREIDEAGTYYLRARHYNGSGRGGYTVQVTDEGVDDHADGPEGATVVRTDGIPVAGDIETGGDNDYFAFDPLPGRIYRLAVTRAGLSDGYVYLYAPDGQTSLYASDVESVTYEFAQGGRHYFRVRHYNGSGRGAYTVTITDEGVDDHADGPEGASALAADGVAVDGVIETRGDNDWFALQLDGGQVYRLTTAGLDVYSALYAQDGVTRLAATGGSQLDVQVPEAGLYFVLIRADSGSSTGAYSVTVVD